MAKKRIVELPEEEARRIYHMINIYYLFIRCLEMIDKSMFVLLKVDVDLIDRNIRKSRIAILELLGQFRRHFKPKDDEYVNYDLPGELFDAMEELSTLHPDKIREITEAVKRKKNEKGD